MSHTKMTCEKFLGGESEWCTQRPTLATALPGGQRSKSYCNGMTNGIVLLSDVGPNANLLHHWVYHEWFQGGVQNESHVKHSKSIFATTFTPWWLKRTSISRGSRPLNTSSWRQHQWKALVSGFVCLPSMATGWALFETGLLTDWSDLAELSSYVLMSIM